MGMTCYFSYSWGEDINKDVMDEIKKQIEKMSNYRISVIYDKHSFHTGDDLKKREQQIKTSDSIVVFFTPSYKEKILTKDKNTGVYREYPKIKKRIEKGDDNIIPILMSGDLKKSVPEEFKTILYSDVSSIKDEVFPKNEGIKFSDRLDCEIKKIVKEVIKKTEVYFWLKDNSFDSLEEEYAALFLNYSAEHNTQLPRDCMIKTDAYDFIINQNGFFVIGRKGGGKTTLLESIRGYDPKLYLDKYKTANSIKAESINLAFIYDELIRVSRADFNTISMVDIIDVFWEVFLSLQCIYNIGLELEHFKINDNDDRKDVFIETVNKLRSRLGKTDIILDDETPRKAISILAVELIVNYWKQGIFNSINTITINASARSNFSSTEVLKNFLGNELLIEFCKAIKRCNKKILLALDGFDPHSEDFRRETSQMRENNYEEFKMRKDFESKFYRELMVTISNLKGGVADNKILIIFEIVDFCIIIPQDRYDEICKGVDRDIAKREICCLSWDAHDLLCMLIRRLCHHYKIKDFDFEDNLLEQFNNIIDKYLPNVSSSISIEINGFNKSISLYEYILRLSFWRPRDIIKNFAVIMKLSKQKIKLSQGAIQEILKKLLANNAEKIIEQEFIGEYKNVYINLYSVLHEFDKCDLIIDFNEFYDKLSKVNIETLSDDNLQTVQEKFELLYKLGVIGLYFDKEEAKKREYGYHICFVFNEGLKPRDDVLSVDGIVNTRAKVMFNLIFLKYLGLNVNTNDLLCNYGEEYIESNHLLKHTIRRI